MHDLCTYGMYQHLICCSNNHYVGTAVKIYDFRYFEEVNLEHGKCFIDVNK